MFLLELGMGFSLAFNFNTYFIFGVIAAFVSLYIYGVFWAVSKKHKEWIIAALVYFSIDVLLSLLFMACLSEGFSFSIILELLVMAWIMFDLVSGTRAWNILRTMPQDVIEQGEGNETHSAHETIPVAQMLPPLERETVPVVQMPPSAAIRPPSKRGKVVISRNYNNLDIYVKKVFGKIELIVDDMVYAEKSGVGLSGACVLEANVNDIIINVTIVSPAAMDGINGVPTTVLLYANGTLFAKNELPDF